MCRGVRADTPAVFIMLQRAAEDFGAGDMQTADGLVHNRMDGTGDIERIPAIHGHAVEIQNGAAFDINHRIAGNSGHHAAPESHIGIPLHNDIAGNRESRQFQRHILADLQRRIQCHIIQQRNGSARLHRFQRFGKRFVLDIADDGHISRFIECYSHVPVLPFVSKVEIIFYV